MFRLILLINQFDFSCYQIKFLSMLNFLLYIFLLYSFLFLVIHNCYQHKVQLASFQFLLYSLVCLNFCPKFSTQSLHKHQINVDKFLKKAKTDTPHQDKFKQWKKTISKKIVFRNLLDQFQNVVMSLNDSGSYQRYNKINNCMQPNKKKIPVTILTGFLGSGKTTLLNHILTEKHGMKIAVIENEFGEVGVDEHLVKQNIYSEEQVIQTMNGCICCTVRGDLSKILKKLLVEEKRTFDAILIETTGMADPAPVAQTFFVDEDVTTHTTLDGIITVVDAKHIIQHLKEEKQNGAENQSIEQVAFADKIILNKTDLVNEEELNEVIKEIRAINAECQIIQSQYSKVHPDKILGVEALKLQKVLQMDPEFLNIDQEHIHDQSVSSCGAVIVEPISLGKLQSWIGELIQTKATDLYRYKGVINVVGMDSPYVFQGVHMLFTGNFIKSGWEDTKTRQTHFCFIGKNIDKEYLINGFKNCVAEKLNYQIGDIVQCKVQAGPNGWKEGVIIAQWDEGNAYRIRLNVGIEVHCPDEIPQLIKLIKKSQVQISEKFFKELEPFENIKKLANDYFILQDYKAALAKYQQGQKYLLSWMNEKAENKNQFSQQLSLKLLKNIGLTLIRMQKFQDSIKINDEIIEKDKSDPKGYYLKGQALMGLGQYEKAKQCLEAGMKIGEVKEIKIALENCNKLISSNRNK